MMLLARICIIPTVILAFSLGPSKASSNNEPFRFALLSEPQTLDPISQTGTQPGYVFSNLFRGLYKYDPKGSLIPIGAEGRCQWKGSLQLRCRLNKKHKWSDGSPVIAMDYVTAFRRMVDPANAAREAGQLMALKGAKAIAKKTSSPESLGVRAEGEDQLVFDFESPDRDFEYRLSSHVLVPMRHLVRKNEPKSYLFSGPYQVKEWKPGKRILLTKNPHYPFGNAERPDVEMLFIDDAHAGLNLFKSNLLDFLPALPTLEIDNWRSHPGFLKGIVMRFDYIGFGPQLAQMKELRKALALGVDFNQFAKLMGSDTPPGCTGLPLHFVDRPPCLKFNPQARVPKDMSIPPLQYGFTKIATDDLRRGAEFFQNQWKKNLGLVVELVSEELGVFRARLAAQPPPIFRAGVALDRPTCLSALETFRSGNPDNFIRLQSPQFDALLNKLQNESSDAKKRRLCREGIEILTNDYWLVPQGRYEIARLISTRFSGVSINEQGQIDLAGLSRK